jgi:hypothetical protein
VWRESQFRKICQQTLGPVTSLTRSSGSSNTSTEKERAGPDAIRTRG